MCRHIVRSLLVSAILTLGVIGCLCACGNQIQESFVSGEEATTLFGVDSSVLAEDSAPPPLVVEAPSPTPAAAESVALVEEESDLTPPELVLVQGDTIHLPVGVEFEEPGYTATDLEDGDITDRVVVSGEVPLDQVGEYILEYTVSDSQGNTAARWRTVFRDPKNDPANVDPGGKVIYLTFDDGPGQYTQQLLDVLDRYGVKATFFVTAQFPGYLDMIAEEVRRGHSVGIHSYTHKFDVYQSEDTYYQDLNAMQDVIRQQTGAATFLVRFPGGSSNTVSANYSSGIMTTLASSLTSKGYVYFDWNVSSGDAGGTTDTKTVYENVIKGIKANGSHSSVVLQHDIKEFSVEAVGDIISWGLNNGYTFLPLTTSSPTCHHTINN